MENIIGLIYTKDYNSSFFAKEIQLPIHVVDFTNILSNIYKAKKDNKLNFIKKITKNPSFLKVLKLLKIDPQDL